MPEMLLRQAIALVPKQRCLLAIWPGSCSKRRVWLRQRRLPGRRCILIQLMVRGDYQAARGFYAAIGYEPQNVVTIERRL
jgi:hypothetical protein